MVSLHLVCVYKCLLSFFISFHKKDTKTYVEVSFFSGVVFSFVGVIFFGVFLRQISGSV